MRARPARLAAHLAALAAALPPAAARAAEPKPGAYCRIPEPGEKPECMGPVREAYGGFFDALDRGEVDAAEIARVEADVAAGSASEGAYLALSSLAYGYYQLAQRAADEPDRDPEVLARLEAWNDLLSSAYEAHGAGDPYRDAVREAAEDVHRRAPAVGLRCLDEEGEPARCDSTEAVLRGLQSGRDATGVRGALGRMLGRLFGEGP